MVMVNAREDMEAIASVLSEYSGKQVEARQVSYTGCGWWNVDLNVFLDDGSRITVVRSGGHSQDEAWTKLFEHWKRRERKTVCGVLLEPSSSAAELRIKLAAAG